MLGVGCCKTRNFCKFHHQNKPSASICHCDLQLTGTRMPQLSANIHPIIRKCVISFSIESTLNSDSVGCYILQGSTRLGVGTVGRIFQLIYSTKLRRDVEDTICGMPTRGKLFEVKSNYKALHVGMETPFPWKSTWKVIVPTKVASFLWTAASGKILTIDNLSRWRILIVDWCCMCKQDEEYVDHLLLLCCMARELFFFSYFACLGRSGLCLKGW